MEKHTPKIYVWCNNCAPEWHSAIAMAEDGHVLAGHVCSSHGFIMHDMGVDEDGWKRDKYAEHYPDGFEVEYVDNARIREHAGAMAAYAKNQELAAISRAEV